MALRSTLYQILAELRSLIGDTATPTVFTDLELQTMLDRNRLDVRYLVLEPVETIAPGGTITYTEYRTPGRYGGRAWEDTAALVTGSYAVLTPASSDLLNGSWTLSSSQAPPVLLSGSGYDLQATAADAYDRWAGRLKLAYDFTADGATFNRSQQIEHLLRLAAEARRLARPRSVPTRV